MCIWRHVAQTQFDHILIHSPDTDVYNIGLPIVAENATKQVILQINLPQSASSLYIYLNNMLTASNLDAELAGLLHHKLPEIFQMLFNAQDATIFLTSPNWGRLPFSMSFFIIGFITGIVANLPRKISSTRRHTHSTTPSSW